MFRVDAKWAWEEDWTDGVVLETLREAWRLVERLSDMYTRIVPVDTDLAST